MAGDPLLGIPGPGLRGGSCHMCQAGLPAVLVGDIACGGAQVCRGLGALVGPFVAWNPLMCWGPANRDIVASVPDASADLHGGYSKAPTWASAIRLKRLVCVRYLLFYIPLHAARRAMVAVAGLLQISLSYPGPT